MKKMTVLAAALMILGFANPAARAGDKGDNDRYDRGHNDRYWVGTWSASPLGGPARIKEVNNATIRQIAHISLGGDTVQVRFSNEMGTTPLVIDEARIARSAGGAQIVPGTSRQLTFGGETSITIPPGSPALSDPVSLHLPPLSDVAISTYISAATPTSTYHELAMRTNYISPGNLTNEIDTSAFAGTVQGTSFYFLTGLSVLAPKQAEAIVILGDSISDGNGTTANANHRWPDLLAARLQRFPSMDHLAVINSGISANRVVTDYSAGNRSALNRFDRDVLRQPGVKYVIVQEGINDILGNLLTPPTPATAENIIVGYRQLIARAHELGLKIYGTTLTPDHFVLCFGTFCLPPLWDAAGEAERKLVNAWIRTSGEFDAVIDFDKALRDPANPDYFLPVYDSGDHLHPSDAGAQAMADFVNLRLFRD